MRNGRLALEAFFVGGVKGWRLAPGPHVMKAVGKTRRIHDGTRQ